MNLFNKIINWYFTKNALPYWSVLIIDCLICYLSGILVFWFYYRGAVTLGNIAILSKTILVYMCFNLIGFRVFRTYSGIIRYSSFVDLQRVAYAMAMSCAIAEVMHYVIYSWDLNFVRLQGRQVFLMYFVATILMWGMRIFVKTVYDVTFSSKNGKRALVLGVKEGGVALAKSIRNTKPSHYQLKGFLTYDHGYRGSIMMGVKVYEIDDELPSLLTELNIRTVLVSPLQADTFRKDQKLQDTLINSGIEIMMVPQSQEWREGDELRETQLKPIRIDDLLPRDQIEVDMPAIGKMLTGKNVMITGSAGSIGSEMVRQIAVYKPANMILIDQAETPQHDIRLMMASKFPDITCETIVVSITQKDRMESIFNKYRPDYLFHAAAYKHVPMMEDNPSEAVYNNVYGTKVIADLSVKYGVKKFVMISTDKAVNPTNVMGCSKRVCEIYCQSLNNAIASGTYTAPDEGLKVDKPCTQFVTTRFGNVLGSNGSVIPLFEKQIKAGGPVTVTDPNIIRYFMLIPEACKLVLEAGTYGQGGQIFVFDMGNPVKIADLARRMIKLSGAQGVEIKYTGLRAGEKLYEELLSTTENTLPSFHEKIRIAQVREYDYQQVTKDVEELFAVAAGFNPMDIVKKMRDMVPEYAPNNTVYSVLNEKADTLFLLLKAELWQQSLPPGARLDRGFYRKLINMAQKQTVDGLLGASLMNQNVRLDKYDLAETMMRTGRIGEKNSLMNKELAELCDLLTRHHIKFFVVKGQTIAAQYPHPENRVSGDIDFYCYPDDFDRCKAIIQDNWQVSIEMDEEEDEQHMHFDHNNVTYEMHFCLMKFSSRRNQSRFDEMIAQATLEHIDIEGVSVPVLPRSLNILYTFLHLYHHLIELGVGLRQFCDVAILLHHAAHDEECKDLLRRQLRKLGFTKAFAAIQAVLFDKLGLSQEAMVLPLSKCAWKYEKRILNIVFKRGNFGKYGRQTAVRSGWKYNLEAFSLKTNHYLSMFPLSPWENAAVLFKSLPAKIVKMALRKSE